MFKDFRRDGFRALVINTSPDHAKDASALVRSEGYSFRLVHAPGEWMHGLGQGANFLIDQRGRLMFRLHFSGPVEKATAARLIGGLLRYGSPR